MDRTHSATVQLSPKGFLVQTTYDPDFVALLKCKIPPMGRNWDMEGRVWIVETRYAAVLQGLLDEYYPGTQVPQVTATHTPHVETRQSEVRYIGATKNRGNNSWSAFGYCHGSWSLVFPEEVLKRWFLPGECSDSGTTTEATLYRVLSVDKKAESEDIKRAWRRLVRQWHPDVCKEPNASAQFRRIQEAYEELIDPSKRAHYDAALALAASARSTGCIQITHGFQPPLRCGLLLVKGYEKVGRFVVSEILTWDDIVQDGKTLVTSWPADADMFVETWA
jgi:hypothetical protein